MTESTIETVSAILVAGGFAAMPAGEKKGIFCKPDAGGWWMGGVHNSGTVYSKNTAISTETTDDPVQAAHDLVALAKRLAPSEQLAAAIELAEDSAHESEPGSGERDGAEPAGAVQDNVRAEPEPHLARDADAGGAGRDEPATGDIALQSDDPLDADFEDAPDLGSELLDDEAFAVPELEAPPPEDFAPDEIEPEPEHAAGAFIFGDNLAHDRIIRIGQLSEHANTLIDAAKVGYSDAEHDAVRSHVVSNLNEAGAYVGGNQALFDRFIELESLTARVRRIEIYRDQRQDFIRAADREAVAAFDPSQGWP